MITFRLARNVFGFKLVVVFFGCHSDKLFGSFGNVIGALDDLLSDQLDVRRTGVVLRSLLTLSVEPAGTGSEQTQRPSHRLRGRPLGKQGSHLCHSHADLF